MRYDELYLTSCSLALNHRYSGLSHWHWGNDKITPVPLKWSWWIRVEFTYEKQHTTEHNLAWILWIILGTYCGTDSSIYQHQSMMFNIYVLSPYHRCSFPHDGGFSVFTHWWSSSMMHTGMMPMFHMWQGRTPIARFMGPTWSPSGANRTQVGPMLAPWTLLSG